jgi:hypothetical protein
MRDERSGELTQTRRLKVENVHEAAHLIQQAVLGSELSPARAVEEFRRLLAAGSMMGVLIDAAAPSGPERVLGVGGAAFVATDFVTAQRAHPRPGLMERVVRSALTDRPVALNRREIEAGNAAAGLCLVVLLHHWVDAEPDAVKMDIRRRLMIAFLDDIRGYRLIEILTEVRTEEVAWGLAGGFRLRTDYSDSYGEHTSPALRRCLMGVSRAEALSAEGSTVSMMFNYTPPRFAFTASQRRLLAHALQHKTDAQIAAALGVSLSAVKKTWAAIFERASGYLDATRPERSAGAQPGRATRGAQKRHTLLTYLQEHPEEMRP